MPRLPKITRSPAPTPSLMRRALTLPVRLIQKAFNTLSIHTSSWFVGLNASWSARAYLDLANAGMTNAVSYRAYRLISDTMSSVGLFAATEEPVEVAKIAEQIEVIRKNAATRRIRGIMFGRPPMKDYKLLLETEEKQIEGLVRLQKELLSLPYREKKKHGDMVLVKDPDHPFVEVLRRPNDEEPSYQNFVMWMVADLFFGGEIFFYTPESAMSGPNKGLPTDKGLFTIRPWRFTRFERDADGMIKKYHWIGPDGRTRATDAARIQHIKMPNPVHRVHSHVGFTTDMDTEERGYPIMLAVWQELQLVEAGNDWNNSVFKNRGRIPGFFKYTGKGKFNEPQHKRTKEQIQDGWRDDTAASMPGLLWGDLEFMQNNISQQEADWLAGIQQYMKWIAVALGVDPALVGDQGSRTLANLSIAVRSLYTLTVLPLLEWIVDEWNARYMVRYGEARLFVDREGIDALQEDRTLQVERAVKAVGAPVMTREEGRATLDLDAEAEGTFFVPSSVVEEGAADNGGSSHLEDPNETKRKNIVDMGKEELFQHVLTLIPNGER